MHKAWHILRRVTVLLLAVIWFQTTAHMVVCHSDNALCGHSGSETVCTCDCHTVFESAADVPVYVEQPETLWGPSSDETTRSLLLPSDIFRPPLTNS